MNYLQLVHEFGKSNKDFSAQPPNWRDDLIWPSGWVFYGECTSVCDTHWIGPTMDHDIRLSVVMIQQATIYILTINKKKNILYHYRDNNISLLNLISLIVLEEMDICLMNLVTVSFVIYSIYQTR